MPKLPVLSGQDCIRALHKAGFSVSRQKGSHIKLKNNSGRTVIVPQHKEIDRGTLRSIINQAGLTIEEFLDLVD